MLVPGLVTLCLAGSDRQKEKKSAVAESHPAIDPSQYVGADACKTCHETAAKGYDKGPHWKTTLAKHEGPRWQGCEACHGPGKEHAESADPTKIIRFPSCPQKTHPNDVWAAMS